jgi:hypothetical protein
MKNRNSRQKAQQNTVTDASVPRSRNWPSKHRRDIAEGLTVLIEGMESFREELAYEIRIAESLRDTLRR